MQLKMVIYAHCLYCCNSSSRTVMGHMTLVSTQHIPLNPNQYIPQTNNISLHTIWYTLRRWLWSAPNIDTNWKPACDDLLPCWSLFHPNQKHSRTARQPLHTSLQRYSDMELFQRPHSWQSGHWQQCYIITHKWKCAYQLVPPNMLQQKVANYVIRAFKELILSRLSNINPEFPLPEEYLFLPQTRLTLSLVWQFLHDPTRSVWEWSMVYSPWTTQP